MMAIYHNLQGLGKPITDDIRNVFDRMLARTLTRRSSCPNAERESLADVQNPTPR